MTWIGNFAVIDTPLGHKIGLITGIQRANGTLSIATIAHPLITDLQHVIHESGLPTQHPSTTSLADSKRTRGSNLTNLNRNRVVYVPIDKPFISTSVQCDVTFSISAVKIVLCCGHTLQHDTNGHRWQSPFSPIEVGNLSFLHLPTSAGQRISMLQWLVEAFLIRPSYSSTYLLPQWSPDSAPALFYKHDIKSLHVLVDSKSHVLVMISKTLKVLVKASCLSVAHSNRMVLLLLKGMEDPLIFCGSSMNSNSTPYVIVSDDLETVKNFVFQSTSATVDYGTCLGVIIVGSRATQLERDKLYGRDERSSEDCPLETPKQIPINLLLKYSKAATISINGICPPVEANPCSFWGLQLAAQFDFYETNNKRVPIMIPLPSAPNKQSLSIQSSAKIIPTAHGEAFKALEMLQSTIAGTKMIMNENPAKIWACQTLLPSFVTEIEKLSEKNFIDSQSVSLLFIIGKGKIEHWVQTLQSLLSFGRGHEVFIDAATPWRWATYGGALIVEYEKLASYSDLIVPLAQGIIVTVPISDEDHKILAIEKPMLLLVSEDDRKKSFITGTWRDCVATATGIPATLSHHNVSLTPPLTSVLSPATDAPLWRQYALMSQSPREFGGYGSQLCDLVRDIAQRLMTCCHAPKPL